MNIETDLHHQPVRLRHNPRYAPDSTREAEPTWQDDALCAQTDPELFFPDQGSSNRAAKKICRACPSRVPCLEEAMATMAAHDHGIRGGLSEKERETRRRKDTAA